MTASVDIGNVTLTYRGVSGGVLALQGTTLNVRRGEFAAVVGPSGCGKSSLMKLVTGLVPPDSGDIVIFGDKVRGPGEDRRHGVPEPEPAALAQGHRQRAASARDRRAAPAEIPQAEGAISRAGHRAAQDRRARRLRRALPLGAVRRHAAARLALPRADPPARAADARRAVRGARCLHARGAVVRAARPLAEARASPSSWSPTTCARPRSSPTRSTS